MITCVTTPVSVKEVTDAVRDPAAGAIDIFIGTTRDNSGGKKVLACEYEAYVPMALRMMEQIAAETLARYGVVRIAAVHRLGRVDVGETSIVIAVSAVHRREAFEACRAVIDRLKHEVPIWKKEVFADGFRWAGNPG